MFGPALTSLFTPSTSHFNSLISLLAVRWRGSSSLCSHSQYSAPPPGGVGVPSRGRSALTAPSGATVRQRACCVSVMAEQRRGWRGGAGRGRKARQFTRGAAVKIGAVAFPSVRCCAVNYLN